MGKIDPYSKLFNTMTSGQQTTANKINTEILLGTVASVEPLVINVENRLPLDADYLTLSALCIRREIEYQTHYSPSEKLPNEEPEENDHNHKINILHWRGLEVGDNVRMIKMTGDQKYFIIDREGMEYDTADYSRANN